MSWDQRLCKRETPNNKVCPDMRILFIIPVQNGDEYSQIKVWWGGGWYLTRPIYYAMPTTRNGQATLLLNYLVDSSVTRERVTPDGPWVTALQSLRGSRFLHTFKVDRHTLPLRSAAAITLVYSDINKVLQRWSPKYAVAITLACNGDHSLLLNNFSHVLSAYSNLRIVQAALIFCYLLEDNQF